MIVTKQGTQSVLSGLRSDTGGSICSGMLQFPYRCITIIYPKILLQVPRPLFEALWVPAWIWGAVV